MPELEGLGGEFLHAVRAGVGEGLIALSPPAVLLLIVVIHAGVAFQGLPSLEPSLARHALERIDTCVDNHMFREVPFCSESFETYLT